MRNTKEKEKEECLKQSVNSINERMETLREEWDALRKEMRRQEAEVRKLQAWKEYIEKVEPGLTDADIKAAFENAIKRGLTNPSEYTYMYTENEWDHFKHCSGRKTRWFPHDSVIERGKEEEKKREERAREYRKKHINKGKTR